MAPAPASTAPAGTKARRAVRLVRANIAKTKHGGRRPIIPRAQWHCLPQWVALHAERAAAGALRCWEGHRLAKERRDGRRHRACVWCEETQVTGSFVHACKECRWVVCSSCARRPQLPALAQDPLFHGPGSRFLLSPPALCAVPESSQGTVIVCPGGNYEFRVPQEGLPAAEMLAGAGIRAYVLCYRLLPKHKFEDMLDDLEDAVAQVRRTHGGPVAAVGFSAGGHLVASLPVRQQRQGLVDCAEGRPDAQALIYPCIDGSDWAHPEWCGFSHFNYDRCYSAAQSLLSTRDALLGGGDLAAPPTFLVASTRDEATPPREHTDKYARGLRKLGVPCTYLRRDFGPHGFGLHGGWTEECLAWLRNNGFGLAREAASSPGRVSAKEAATVTEAPADPRSAAAALGGA